MFGRGGVEPLINYSLLPPCWDVLRRPRISTRRLAPGRSDYNQENNMFKFFLYTILSERPSCLVYYKYQMNQFENRRFWNLYNSFSSFFERQKVKYLSHLLINHPNFFSESSYSNYLQFLSNYKENFEIII